MAAPSRAWWPFSPAPASLPAPASHRTASNGATDRRRSRGLALRRDQLPARSAHAENAASRELAAPRYILHQGGPLEFARAAHSSRRILKVGTLPETIQVMSAAACR